MEEKVTLEIQKIIENHLYNEIENKNLAIVGDKTTRKVKFLGGDGITKMTKFTLITKILLLTYLISQHTESYPIISILN